MKTLIAIIIGGVIGFTVANDPGAAAFAREQTAWLKKAIHDWTE